MLEAEASLELLYFQAILLNCSYDFLYRCEPKKSSQAKGLAVFLLLRSRDSNWIARRASSVIQRHAQLLAASMVLRCALPGPGSQARIDEVRTVNSVLTFCMGRLELKLISPEPSTGEINSIVSNYAL